MSAQICPVVGTTTNVLPPNHPSINNSKAEDKCPVTLAVVGDHSQIIHNHPTATNFPTDPEQARDATACPALQHANDEPTLTNATCPVVGPVNALLPPDHPALQELDQDQVCPKTNATMKHHKQKVHQHPAVEAGASISKCPVAGAAA